MNLECSPMATRVVLMTLTQDDLRLVTRSTISDTKGDTTTTTLLVTVLLPCTETVVDVHVQKQEFVKEPSPFCELLTEDTRCFTMSSKTGGCLAIKLTLSWPGCEARRSRLKCVTDVHRCSCSVSPKEREKSCNPLQTWSDSKHGMTRVVLHSIANLPVEFCTYT